MGVIKDPEVKKLVKILAPLAQEKIIELEKKGEWAESPFIAITKLPSRTKGAVAEQVISGYLEQKGFPVERTGDSEADRIVAGMRTEIKLSTRWKTGIYNFQQIRDQDYKILIMLGVSPYSAHLWAVPKTIIEQRIATGDIRSQHRGEEGEDTKWLSFPVESPPEWLTEYGGTLAEGVESLRRIVAQAKS